MGLRLGHICLGTKKLEEMISFYVERCACRIIHEFRNPAGERYGAFLEIDGSATHLELFNQTDPDPDEKSGSFRHLCLQCDDIEKVARAFIDAGYPVKVERGRTDNVLQFWVQDPDGHKVEFHQYDDQVTFSPPKETA